MKKVLSGILLLLSASLLKAAEAPTREENLVWSADRDTARQAEYAGNEDILLRPGLVADRKSRTVVIDAEATGISPNEPVEFFIIGINSGHDYEAIAVAFACPGDVRQALEFIGLPPGRPVDFEKLYFWPKGERVLLTVDSDDEAVPLKNVPLEKLVFDKRIDAPMRTNGIVFTGSVYLEEDGERKLAAATREPHSIAASYNEQESLLDVPMQAQQGSVYKYHHSNPAFPLRTGQRLVVTMRPERPLTALPRVLDIKLQIKPANHETPAQSPGDVVFLQQFADADEHNLQPLTLNGWLEQIAAWNKAQRDPFVTVSFHPGLPLKTVRELSRLLNSINSPQGIRVEPPPAGHLHFQAFLTDERLADRNQRNVQPPELHVARVESGLQASLTLITETWHENQLRPELSFEEVTLSTPKDLRQALERANPRLPVLLIYAADNITYGDILPYIGTASSSHHLIHVFFK